MALAGSEGLLVDLKCFLATVETHTHMYIHVHAVKCIIMRLLYSYKNV